jgi:hypothetical protein
MSCKACSSKESLICQTCIQSNILPLQQKLLSIQQKLTQKRLHLNSLISKFPVQKIKILNQTNNLQSLIKKRDKGKKYKIGKF